jgi:hypothetical protein
MWKDEGRGQVRFDAAGCNWLSLIKIGSGWMRLVESVRGWVSLQDVG